jgi:hypothetical protein
MRAKVVQAIAKEEEKQQRYVRASQVPPEDSGGVGDTPSMPLQPARATRAALLCI